MKFLLLSVVGVFILNNMVQAAGFNKDYKAYQGDINGDGLNDLYVRHNTSFITIATEFMIFIPQSVADINHFVLQNKGDGKFELLVALTSEQTELPKHLLKMQ